MREFSEFHNFEAHFPYVVQISNRQEAQAYEEWCQQCLGPMLSRENQNGIWFYSLGYFFFASRTAQAQFVRLASIEARARLAHATKSNSQNTGTDIKTMRAKLQIEFAVG